MVKLYLFIFYIYFFKLKQVNSIFYDTYHGVRISNEDLVRHDKANTTSWCLADIMPCDPNEGRRIDGSCSHLNNPLSGVANSHVRRLLPAYYAGDFEPVTISKSGDPLPLPRVGRTTALPAGKLPSNVFTQLASYFLVHIFADVASIHDSVNYILWKPYCCLPEGKKDKQCAPNIIPIDDPVHRFSGIRCMNLTRPNTFQDVGCAPKGTEPMRIIPSTPLIDLSVVYGNSVANLSNIRSYNKGSLRYELDSEGRIWPPSKKGEERDKICRLNQLPHETRCHDVPQDSNNALLGQNLFLVWSWRHHNKIAQTLSKLNPCWNDEKLFNTARDINLAYTLQVFFYELLPRLLGRKNLINSGLISPSPGFRDLYKENVDPLISVEYSQAMRWLHTIQEGSVKMYHPEGHYLKEFPIVNFTLNTGYVANNIDYITQGAFRQSGGSHDHMIDPDMSERILGPHQRASDVATSDLHKNRLSLLQPYVKYLEFCYGTTFTKFNHLKGHIDDERIRLLKTLYTSVEDIDLTVGMWLENFVPGGNVPPSFYCIVVEQWLRNIESDRHWYERPNRPNAFTIEQLFEIRKASMAEWLCEVGDNVTKIQRSAFLVSAKWNKRRSCEEIDKVDYNVWKDETCQKQDVVEVPQLSLERPPLE